MKRRTFLSALAVMFTALILAFTATNEAAAQQDPNCCTYKIDVAGVPATCFPFNIHSFWATGFPVVPVAGNGVTTHAVPGACPLAGAFFGASINGLLPIASFNNPVCYNVGGCNLVIRIGFDGSPGCVRIYVRPC